MYAACNCLNFEFMIICCFFIFNDSKKYYIFDINYYICYHLLEIYNERKIYDYKN